MTPNVEELHAEYGRDLHRFLRVMGATHSEADDAVQETFLAVLQRPFEHRSQAETAGYLRTVAKNLFRKSLRKTRRIVTVDMETIEQDWAAVADDDGAQSKVDALKECMRGLKAKEREVLKLRYEDHAKREQMAAALSMSEGGVKNLLERVKRKLKACVQRRTGNQATQRR